MRRIELLAPARTADIGIEAFRHGADAVYIGAPVFSARVAAGNSVADIERMARFGHLYGARTMVALNTILTDAELPEAERLTWQLYEAGVDALIVQDLGLLQLHLPPMELHASTQTDNRTAERVALMHQLGMSRVVLARELSVQQINEIHQSVPDVELECFVHGALCVSYSGQCYLSAALTGRSANRGACAQPCRLPMDLTDADGNLVARQRHLLSLCDMNRSQHVEALLDAGVTSLKIEGRLKDQTYVKNVTAYYRQLLDNLFERRADDYQPLSAGRCTYTFQPDPQKSFNRGFTPYFADGQRAPMWNMDTPKSMGEELGRVREVGPDFIQLTLSQPADLHNGDGLAIRTRDGFVGFRLNRYDATTGRIYPLEGRSVCQQLKRGDVCWRNLDTAFEKLLASSSAKRRMSVALTLDARPMEADSTRCVLRLVGKLAGPDVAFMTQEVAVEVEAPADEARQSQADNMSRQLGKLGETPFAAERIDVLCGSLFVPSSLLSQLRREWAEAMQQKLLEVESGARKSYCAPDYANRAKSVRAVGILPASYLANVYNRKARQTYADMGLADVEQAFENQTDRGVALMQTRHCLKYAFGQCPRYPNPTPERSLAPHAKLGNQATLTIGGRKFLIKFGCKNDCISEIFPIFAAKNEKSNK